MKPGNLLRQGAKSGGSNREMRKPMFHAHRLPVRVFVSDKQKGIYYV